MRIIMMTDDEHVDRRILQEANSLIAVGHEVILIAGRGKGQPRFEWIGKIKVERFSPSDPLQPVFPSVSEINLTKSRFARLKRLEAWYLAYRISMYWARLYVPYLGSVLLGKAKSLARAVKGSIRTRVPRVRGPSLLAGVRWSRAGVRSLCVAMFRHARHVQALGARVTHRRTDRLVDCISQAAPDGVVEAASEPLALSMREERLLACARRYSPDVVHAHDLPMLGAAIYLKRELGVPVIYDAHELYPEICTLAPEDKVLLDQKERTFIRECDMVITVNPFIATEMASRYAIAGPTVVFNAAERPSGFDARQSNALLRDHFAISDQHQILLYQGWMSRTRGLQLLCAAMSDVREDIHLIFMGYGEAQRELEEIVRCRNLEKRVHFKSAVPQSELLFWTASADAGIIPYQNVDLNNYYCSPNKLFEFILAGVPIVGNDLPFLRSVIAGEGFGLVRRLDDEADYAKAINEMFDAAAGGPARFRSRLLARQDHYSWDVEKSKILDLYSRLDLNADRGAEA